MLHRTSATAMIRFATRTTSAIALWSILMLAGGCATLGTMLGRHDPVEDLRNKIDAVFSDSIFTQTRVSAKVVSLETKEVLYDRESAMLMRPASNMKLLTSSTSIAVLGSDFSFKTVVSIDSPVVNGTVGGNVYLKGFGNPDLQTSDLEWLAAQMKAEGISEVKGDIVADVSYFDDLYWGNGWMWDDEPEPDEMFITPLSLNDNCVRVTVTPGSADGDSVRVQITPPTSYLSLQNNARTVKDSIVDPLRITRRFKERENTIVVHGQMKIDSQHVEQYLSVWQPELYTAHVFKETLEKSGIIVRGGTKIDFIPSSAQTVASHERRLDSVVVNLNKISDNLSAENMLKTLSAERWKAPGNASSGVSIVNEFLSSLGIDTTRYRMVDGSGVSHYNLLSANVLTQLLEGMARRDDLFPLFFASLPIAGVDGTLKNRMRSTRAEGNLRAKTGSLSAVSSLSGYVKTLDGETLIFSILMQSFIGSSRAYRLAQDRVGVILASFSRKRSMESTAP